MLGVAEDMANSVETAMLPNKICKSTRNDMGEPQNDESVEAESEEESDASFRNLGEDDSVSITVVRKNAPEKSETIVNRAGAKQPLQGEKRNPLLVSLLGISKEVKESLSKRLRWDRD